MTNMLNNQQTAVTNLPKPIKNIILNNKTNQSPSFFDSQSVHAMQQATSMSQTELGLALLPLAASFAVTPVSNFHVGAVAFDSVGNAYLGANFEFANTHIGQTIHAEQSAIAHAWQRGAKDLQLLVINYAPCGHCRQFINEVKLTDDFLIQLPDTTAKPLSHYLPESFGGADLGIAEQILANNHLNFDELSVNALDLKDSDLENLTAEQLTTEHLGEEEASSKQGNTSKEQLTQLAKIAHDSSHAPYSGSRSGLALEFADGDIITGRYAENAAFNPTLPALQVALNHRRLQGKDWQAINQAIMLETVTTLSQRQNTQELLQQIAGINLQHQVII